MARHYYRTNVPLPIMIIWWVFLGFCVLIYGCYDAVFKAPERNATRAAQAKWERDHFTGWRLEAQPYEREHGLYSDKLDGGSCTTLGYPGYKACPPQQYLVNGSAQAPPVQYTTEPSPTPRPRKTNEPKYKSK